VFRGGLFNILNSLFPYAPMATRPLIGIPADRRIVGAHPFHMVGEKYARAVMEAAGAAPLLIPAFAEELRFSELLERLDGVFSSDRVRVNSLHSQGIDRLGDELAVEARAPDGVIEAFRVTGARSFALAVQWHPEWQVMSNPFSQALFAAFGEASRERAQSK